MLKRVIHPFLVFWGLALPEPWFLILKAQEIAKMLAELRHERKYLDRQIASLEQQLIAIQAELRNRG